MGEIMTRQSLEGGIMVKVNLEDFSETVQRDAKRYIYKLERRDRKIKKKKRITGGGETKQRGISEKKAKKVLEKHEGE